MNVEKTELFCGKDFEILEMVLTRDEYLLNLSWKVYFENKFFLISFYNVSRFRIGEISIPLAIQGFEIINHSQDGWEKDSTYEIRDFEDDYVHFFCESIKIT